MRARSSVLVTVLVSVLDGVRAMRAQVPPELVADANTVAIARGATVQSFRIVSLILNETRRVHLVLPASFRHSASDRRYPVTIVLDGEDNVPPIAAVTDELSRNGQIPESVIVAIPNTDRLRDLTPPGLSVSGSSRHEGGDRFLDFIERELLPAVDRQFRGGAPRVFIGHSSGGILATYLAATRSTFRAIVAIDTPTHLDENWLPSKLIARAAAAPMPLRYATYEARFGWRDDTWEALVAAAPKSWQLHREHLAGESHESMAMLGMYLGLREVFRDYSVLAAPVAPTTSILPYYAQVSADLGATVLPPSRLLHSVVEDLLAEGRGALARDAYDILASGYGVPADGTALLARMVEVERRPAPKETVEGLLATPFPSPEEADEYLGEWVGDEWMNAEAVRSDDIALRLRVEDGRVVGETVYHPTATESLVMRWQYLKITPSGMTWGFMNGMRPRGVLLYEGTFDGDNLAGESRLGGMDFRRPDGSRPPPLHFSFKRAGP